MQAERTLNFALEIPYYLGIFGLELEKATVLWYFTSATQIFFKQSFVQK